MTRRRLQSSVGAATLVVLMFGGAVVLWLGIPLAWLWVGSRLQAETGSVGTALAGMMAGMIASVVALTWSLGQLNRRHAELQELRGRGAAEVSVLERVLVLSAAVAVIVFGAWFLVFSGSEPIPLKIGY